MIKATYGLAGVQVAALLFLVAQYAFGPGTAGSSGGAEMGLFFFTLLPLAALLLATAVFRFARGGVLRGAAAFAIMAAPAVLTYLLIDGAMHRARNDAARRDYASGRGYFTGPEAQALGEAIMRDDAAAVAAAVGATDVNQAGVGNQTFLALAMTRTEIDVSVVRSLLVAGADPNRDNGWPLGATVSRGDVGLATLLLEAGANPNGRGAFGSPAFFGALDKPDMLALLLRKGAQVDAEADNGETALMRATWNGHWAAVALLLQAGADAGHVSTNGTGLAKSIAFVRGRASLTGQPVPPELLKLEALLRELPIQEHPAGSAP